MKNQFGKPSIMEFKTAYKDHKTVISDMSFTAPFKIIPPFSTRDGGIEVMPLMASAGIMEGDQQYHNIEIGEHSHVKFISQSFEKVHKMKDGYAKRDIVIQVASNAFLDYSPLPIIPFADSAFVNTMEVNLQDDSSRFILNEIISCGRAAAGERFQFRFFQSRINIRKQNSLIYRDNTYYNPKMFPMEDIGFFEGYSHLANLVFCNIPRNQDWLLKVQALIDKREPMSGAATYLNSRDVAIRILGSNAQVLQEICEDIKAME